MGKPRMIILVRHAQSEGNKNRDIHQFIPDHRVKLTADGWNQAEEAGRRLRSLLKPDDTLQFFTSPYRRTRETTEGILRTLTSDDPAPTPFPRHKIKVFEEPRLREQDFGNFQPCSAEMERMWQERADYGHFFYRIPNGESAADAYDRISGFNESMWRLFNEPDFPSVSVLVTHGMMTRVFLMKWYHWSVEYFEDLRNINHCEFIIMKQKETNGKYILQNELRTWSDLKKRAAEVAANNTNGPASTPSKNLAASAATNSSSPTIPVRRWGGCVNGCDHDKIPWPRKARRQNTADFLGGVSTPAAAAVNKVLDLENEKEDHPIASQEADHAPMVAVSKPRKSSSAARPVPIPAMPLTPASPNDASNDAESSESDDAASSTLEEGASGVRRGYRHPQPRAAAILRHLHPGRDGGGRSTSIGEGMSDDSDYFPGMAHHHHHSHGANQANFKATNGTSKLRHRANSRQRTQSKERKSIARRMSEAEWKAESGMGSGARADALGDGDVETSDEKAPIQGDDTPILREALKGNMVVEEPEEEADMADRTEAVHKTAEEVEKLKIAEKKSLDEVY